MSDITIDNEQIEEKVSEIQYIKDILGLTLEKFKEYKQNVIYGFQQFGNDFHGGLALALIWATTMDAVKILHFWQNDCTQHDLMYRIAKAKEIAENS
jgi:hypothetical protein